MAKTENIITTTNQFVFYWPAPDFLEILYLRIAANLTSRINDHFQILNPQSSG